MQITHPLFLLTLIALPLPLNSKITPNPQTPISTTISNTHELSIYEFSFMLEKEVPANGVLEIEFPKQYQENLGVYLWTKCTYDCTVVDYLVTLDLPDGLAMNVLHSVKIEGIRNPLSIGWLRRKYW